jgi:hypothetical protein
MIDGGHGAYAPLPTLRQPSLERECFAHLHHEKQINARMRAI